MPIAIYDRSARHCYNYLYWNFKDCTICIVLQINRILTFLNWNENNTNKSWIHIFINILILILSRFLSTITVIKDVLVSRCIYCITISVIDEMNTTFINHIIHTLSCIESSIGTTQLTAVFHLTINQLLFCQKLVSPTTSLSILLLYIQICAGKKCW